MARAFYIAFSPTRSDEELEVARRGETLEVNGMALDFSGLAEGDRREAAEFGCAWLVEEVTCTDGGIRVMLMLPHGAGAPEAVLFPAPRMIEADGPVPLPA